MSFEEYEILPGKPGGETATGDSGFSLKLSNPRKYLCPKHGEVTGTIQWVGAGGSSDGEPRLCEKCYWALLKASCCAVTEVPE